jgi:cysteinyl-tRNA synthetase
LFQPGDGADTTETSAGGDELLAPVMALVLALRQEVRGRRDFATADRIRDTLATAGIAVKDSKDGANWSAAGGGTRAPLDAAMQVVIDLRAGARAAKDFATADRIRQELGVVGIAIADGAAGATWSAQR